jgi:hypothetical protein
MPKPIDKWFLFQYVDGKLEPLSRPFKSKELADKARSKYPERERKKIGVGFVRGLSQVRKKAMITTARHTG